MLTLYQNYLTLENIYLWSSFGVIPFWIMLILIPNSRFTQFFVNSVTAPLILASAYVYIIYQAILLDEAIFDIFKIYLSLDDLYTLFATESFLLIFWLHFLTLNLFIGAWAAQDGVKYNISRTFMFFPLVLIYFTGPLGLVFYWIIRIFYAKKLKFHD
ncbi:ABA4-like family protein [Pelagibacteraceae bacterium]|nr:ABA4-like family protein [Pelagibacteraceae bacterium]